MKNSDIKGAKSKSLQSERVDEFIENHRPKVLREYVNEDGKLIKVYEPR